MAFRHTLSLYLILAFIWSEGALSFSSISRGTKTCPTKSTKTSIGTRMMQSQQSTFENTLGVTVTTSARHSISNTQMTMSSDESSSEKEVTTEKEGGDKSNNTQPSNVILMFPLVCKFMVVLMIKFLTDLVVYPSLLLFRLARRTKGKIVSTFDKISFGTTAKSFKPNGSGQK